jgi:uncharacterized protein
MGTPPEPSEHLDPRARTLWRLSYAFTVLVLLIITLPVSAGLWWGDVDLPLVAAPPLVILGFGLAAVAFLPNLLWRHWRYELREDEIDLQHGLWTVTRTLIPLARVQHVDTRRGPLQQRFGLASLVLYTAAGASEIPALALPTAHALRDQIGALAKRFDDV